MEDPCLESVSTFDKLADRYAQKYFALDQYDRFYQMLLDCLPAPGAAVIDVACGPGNASAYFTRVRPDLSVLGVDLSPRMIEQARSRVPAAEFQVLDCRNLQELRRQFDGAVFAFGLSYLSDADADRFFVSLNQVMCPTGVLLLSTVAGAVASADFESSSTGDRVFMVIRTPEEVGRLVEAYGYRVEFLETIASPAQATTQTRDVVLLARKVPRPLLPTAAPTP